MSVTVEGFLGECHLRVILRTLSTPLLFWNDLCGSCAEHWVTRVAGDSVPL